MLKELRLKRGLSQDDLAEAMGCHRSTLAMIETGKNHPSVELAKKLGEFFGVEWNKFFED